MPEKRYCEACGAQFWVTDAELAAVPEYGKHLPSKCPEGLDLMCPSCDPGPQECKSCRPKQDNQRA